MQRQVLMQEKEFQGEKIPEDLIFFNGRCRVPGGKLDRVQRMV